LINALLARAYETGYKDGKINREPRVDEMKISAAHLRKLDDDT